MIEPTSKDMGKKVMYCDDYDNIEFGVIVGFNHRYVFVRYGENNHSKATSREDLHWSKE